MTIEEIKTAGWTTSELAARADVSQAYIRQMLLSGRLRGAKRGRDWLIPDEEAQRWLANRKPRKKRAR